MAIGGNLLEKIHKIKVEIKVMTKRMMKLIFLQNIYQ